MLHDNFSLRQMKQPSLIVWDMSKYLISFYCDVFLQKLLGNQKSSPQILDGKRKAGQRNFLWQWMIAVTLMHHLIYCVSSFSFLVFVWRLGSAQIFLISPDIFFWGSLLTLRRISGDDTFSFRVQGNKGMQGTHLHQDVTDLFSPIMRSKFDSQVLHAAEGELFRNTCTRNPTPFLCWGVKLWRQKSRGQFYWNKRRKGLIAGKQREVVGIGSPYFQDFSEVVQVLFEQPKGEFFQGLKVYPNCDCWFWFSSLGPSTKTLNPCLTCVDFHEFWLCCGAGLVFF